jgi:hypothetical protein
MKKNNNTHSPEKLTLNSETVLGLRDGSVSGPAVGRARYPEGMDTIETATGGRTIETATGGAITETATGGPFDTTGTATGF